MAEKQAHPLEKPAEGMKRTEPPPGMTAHPTLAARTPGVFPVQHVERPYAMRPDAHRDVGAERGFAAQHAHDFAARSVRHMDAEHFRHWRAGNWRNEWHYGRLGWWWEVDGVWYPYDNIIFPFPVEVAEIQVYEAPQIDPGSVDQPPAPQSGAAPAAGVNPPVADAAPPPAQSGEPVANKAAAPYAATALKIPLLPAPVPGTFHCDAPLGDFAGVPACQTAWQFVPAPDQKGS